MKKNGVIAKPQWILVKGFAYAIALGTVVLMLPVSHGNAVATDSMAALYKDFVVALFTATSATCVTGLSVVDIGTYYSHFGQLAILALIQLGGLGIMTISTLFLILVGRKLGTQEEFVLMDSLGARRLRGVRSLLWSTLLFAFIFEAAGAVILFWRLVDRGFTPGHAAYSGIFHSISAFCNAGFSLYASNLADFASDPVFILTIAALIVMGGIGFLVLHDVGSFKFWRHDRLLRGRLSLHTRLVLRTTLLLLVVGWVGIGLLEWRHALSGLGLRDKLTVSFFHSVSPRTAGYNILNMAEVVPLTLYLTMALMFIGGSPASTAGGIKTTCLVVLLVVVRAVFRGKEEFEVADRTVSIHVVREALTIFILSLFFVAAMFGILLMTESPPLLAKSIGASDELMFEVVSAFGTVGLSTGITPFLSVIGKLCIVGIMFVGRLGPLAIALVIGRKEVRQVLHYPEEEVVVG